MSIDLYSSIYSKHIENVCEMCFIYFYSILLHAKVGEYSQCYVIASIWLKAAKNFSDVNYVSLVEIYIVNILLPRNERNRIDSFLDACPGLSSSQRKRMCTEYVETTTQVGTSAQNIDTGRLTREIISKQKATVVKGDE